MTGNTIGQWARWGYIRASQSRRRPARLLGRGRAGGGDRAQRCSPAGVAHAHVRRAIAQLGTASGRCRRRRWPPPARRGRGSCCASDDGVYALSPRGWQRMVAPPPLEDVRLRLKRRPGSVRRVWSAARSSSPPLRRARRRVYLVRVHVPRRCRPTPTLLRASWGSGSFRARRYAIDARSRSSTPRRSWPAGRAPGAGVLLGRPPARRLLAARRRCSVRERHDARSSSRCWRSSASPAGHFMGPAACPSGHTTAVMSLALALVIVAPPRLRPLPRRSAGC